MKIIGIFILTVISSLTWSCQAQSEKKDTKKSEKRMINQEAKNEEVATFGTGCFWCTEAVFETLDGVSKVVSGYAGGHVANPTYRQVCDGNTGHAECVQITFDPTKVSYVDLLQAFFRSHDPTSLNRQGADVGTQYRSVIFYNNEEQRKLARDAVMELDKSGSYPRAIVTEVSKAPVFYVAEDYHQDYYAKHPGEGYCAAVIAPKLDKFRQVFKEKLKKNQ